MPKRYNELKAEIIITDDKSAGNNFQTRQQYENKFDRRWFVYVHEHS